MLKTKKLKSDRIIEGFQDKISKLEEERNHNASVLITHESLCDEVSLDNGQGLPQPNNKVNRANNTRIDNDPSQQKVKQKSIKTVFFFSYEPSGRTG